VSCAIACRVALFCCDSCFIQRNSDDDDRCLCIGGPPSYDLSVGNQPMPQQQTGPAYNPAIAAASAPYPSGYGGDKAMAPLKM